MTITEIVEANNFYIAEGISLFKNSRRLLKLADKMERNLQYVKNENESEEIEKYIVQLKAAANEFADVEQTYETGSKVESLAKYNRLKIKYFNLVKAINTETMKKFALGMGTFLIIITLMNVFAPVMAKEGNTGAAQANDPFMDLKKETEFAAQKAETLKDESKKAETYSKALQTITKKTEELIKGQKKLDELKRNARA